MARYYMSTFAKCPFYRYEEPNAVYCEGLMQGSTIKLYRRKGHKLGEFKAQYCRDAWEECPIARMLLDKYEESESQGETGGSTPK